MREADLIKFPYPRRADNSVKSTEVAPGTLGFDFHSHLMPGVDDGMDNLQDAQTTIAGLKGLGFSGAILTPHLYHGVFDNQAAQLRIVFDQFCIMLKNAGIEFPLHLAGEYFADAHFLKLIEQDDLLYTPVGDERWVLLEFPYLQESPFATACLAALVARGYRPIVAHVERYRFVAADPDGWLDCFARYGAILQGDIGSLAGQHGEAVKRLGRWLLDRNLIEIWGTDIHRPKQIKHHIIPGLAQLSLAKDLNGALNPMLAGLAI